MPANLEKRIGELYGASDGLYLPGLDDAAKENIVEEIAADIAGQDSYLPRLGRAEIERNVRNGLSIADPARVGMGISFEPFRLTKAGYEHAKAAVIEAGKSIDSETFRATSDYNEEVLGRAAFALIGRPYIPQGDERERVLMADPGMLDGFADAFEKARAVYMENVPEARTNVLEPPRPKPRAGPREGPAERKGFVARHRKAIGIGIAGLFAAAAGFGIYTVMNNTPRNQFINGAKAKGYSEADAGRTWDDIQKAVSNDGRISAKDAVTMDTANSMLGLGYMGNYATATRQAVANLTAAYRLGLPKLDSTSMRAITNATQLDNDIVNFQPIKIKDTNGNDVSVGSTNVQRDFWLLANLLGRYTGLAKQPEKHEWVNEMVKQVAYDGMRGDSGVPDGFLKVLYGFHDYMDALPAKMQADGLGDYVALHYLDSMKLKAEIPDTTNRTVALMCLAHIPRDFYSVSENKSATGIPGMQLFVDSLGPKYAELKNGFFNATTRYEALKDYYDWTVDRRNNGLEFTVEKYVGLVWDRNGYMTWDDYIKFGEDVNGIGLNHMLNKYWGKPWDMIKFIKGYDAHTVGEVDSYRYSMPLSFKAMGVPYGRFLALPYISGTSLDEWAVPVPTSVLNAVKAGMPGQKIVSGYGNMVSLYSCVDGAQKDGINMITQSMSSGKGDPILWKK